MKVYKSKPNILKEKLKNGEITVAVYGLGHIGLPIAIAWLHAGAKVIGVDKNEQVVNQIKNKTSPITNEPGIQEAIKKYVTEKKLTVTTDSINASKNSDVKIVAVPTLLTSNKKCDTTPLQEALHSIGKGLKKGDLVIIECSVPPTTTQQVAKSILEKESHLKAGQDFGLTYSPERVYEGRTLEDIEKRYPKIVGGIDPKSTEAAAALYEVIAEKGAIKMQSATAAETVKIFEGIYRDVNIALANELAKFCAKLNLDYMELRSAANTQPYSHLHMPGCGVGGLCIPFYPYFAMEIAAKYNLPLPIVQLARTTNENMPAYTVKLAGEELKKIGQKIENINIAILGLTFRGDVADTRNSPTYEIIQRLKEKNAKIKVYDPYVKKDETLEKLGIPLMRNLKAATENASLVIIAADHTEFKKLTAKKLTENTLKPTIILDGRNVIALEKAKMPADIRYVGLGR
jgi:nucleotide sugar dehydrogenase